MRDAPITELAAYYHRTNGVWPNRMIGHHCGYARVPSGKRAPWAASYWQRLYQKAGS